MVGGEDGKTRGHAAHWERRRVGGGEGGEGGREERRGLGVRERQGGEAERWGRSEEKKKVEEKKEEGGGSEGESER